MDENTDKTKHDQEIKSKLQGIKIASRVERRLCLHCGEKPMMPNSGLCSECRQLPRYKELLAPEGENFKMEPEDVLHYDGDIMINKDIEHEPETHSSVWVWDLIEWVYKGRILDTEILARTEGYYRMSDGKGGHFWRKQS